MDCPLCQRRQPNDARLCKSRGAAIVESCLEPDECRDGRGAKALLDAEATP